LLAGLAGKNGRLREAGGAYVIHRASGAGWRQESPVPKELVLLCLRNDWLKRDGNDLVLSPAGRAWLRRAASAGDGFREQHQLRSTQTREVEGSRRPVLVNDAESPLGWLRSRKDGRGARSSPTTNMQPVSACARIIGLRS
jgi:hypothetical protein